METVLSKMNLLLSRAVLNRPGLYRNTTCTVLRRSSQSPASSWARMRQFLKQHGTIFLVVKFGSFTPLMYLCYNIPSAVGYNSISEFVLAQEWIKRFVDVESHLPDPNDVKPLPFIQVFNDYSPIPIPEQYMTKTFLFDLAATWIIYEFIIAPVKWPYYFITTRMVVNVLRKRGWIKAKLPSSENTIVNRTKEATKRQLEKRKK